MVRPSRGEPSPAGWAKERAATPRTFQRQSYSRQPSPVLAHAAEVVVGAGEVGSEAQRLVEAGFGLVQPAALPEHDAPIVGRVGVGRVAAPGPLKALVGRVELPLPEEEQSQFVM